MKIAISAILFYLLGLLVFLTVADFGIPVWSQIYHLWDKLKDLLMITGIYGLLPKYRKAIRWPLLYSLIRVGWEAVAWITKADINSRQAVNNLFLLLATVCMVLLLKDLRQWQRQKLS